DGIRVATVTGVQTCALPILPQQWALAAPHLGDQLLAADRAMERHAQLAELIPDGGRHPGAREGRPGQLVEHSVEAVELVPWRTESAGVARIHVLNSPALGAPLKQPVATPCYSNVRAPCSTGIMTTIAFT